MKVTNQIKSGGETKLSRCLCLLMLTLLVGISSFVPHAEASDKTVNRERAALRRVQQQLSQTQGQIGNLEQEKTKLAEDLDKAQKSSKDMEGKTVGLQRALGEGKWQQTVLAKELAATKAELGTTKELLAQAQKSLSETGSKLTETTQTLQKTDTEKRNLQTIKVRNERDIASCEQKNLALYQVGRSLMDRFEKKTCAETLAQKEPFTGLKRVETENLLEEYRDKLDEQKLIKPPGG
jgi:chromosome segregation ATPase